MNPARPFKKARSVNSDSTGLPTWVSSELGYEDTYFADPATAAGRVITRLSVRGGGGVVPCWMKLMPFGLGSENDAFAIRVVGVQRVLPQLSDGRTQFIRTPIAGLTAILSANVGVAGGNVVATERFSDTLAITQEGTYTSDVTRGGSIRLYNPAAADLGPSFALIPLVGCEGYEIEFDQTTGTPTMNALISFLDGDG